jgi:hypothetical protein
MSMRFFSILPVAVVLFAVLSIHHRGCAELSPDPKALIQESVDAMGGKQAFYAKEGVVYTYTYRKPDGKEDISTETYRFSDEYSKAVYSKRELLFPDQSGEMVQVYDGKTIAVTLDGKAITEAEVVKRADFLRKTNYYWFAMMFKLLDPGLVYSYEGSQHVDGVDYQKVKVGFEDGIGDVKDTYLLYINSETKLIDFFLFTVMDFGRDEPLLMKVEYETVDGIQLPATRKYMPAHDWQANHDPAGPWVDEIMTDICFTAACEQCSL